MTLVVRQDSEIVMERGGGDDDVVISDRLASSPEVGPDSSVHPRNLQIKGDYGQPVDDRLHERLPPTTPNRRICAVHTVKKLRNGDGSQVDRLVAGPLEERFDGLLPPLELDEDARIDQEGHGPSEIGAWSAWMLSRSSAN